ncbi:DNA repair endonuclease UVH1 isoform X1 [Selaginella moellendorffii]|uniref:DNA repair endonuclease UVH1 isoform X1 n=2 Tax=Selaginella moellendorffii TaxID=88036 RepID=UPI000D1C7C7B|nr:DNA repair endonuclease UVH1 isoform X1 [Selaginella moellendorffii]XP_024534736.1 DNA repair endonuclease UVH1 isoform X1 [Selaginella moellendorffii]|eukprot:XP_024534735.1 DNA repair endonuclease UVH1 isoform X1 [Selaginella moellendorffii]
MLNFQEEIVSELVQENALAVVAAGLGLPSILAALVRLHSSSSGVLFLLSVPDDLRRGLRDELQAQDIGAEQPVEINTQFTAAERAEMYSKGGAFLVTSRILVVDMLNERVPFHKVAGIIVNNSHRMTETCAEAFIVRLYRSKNKAGYVRGISDQARGLTSGFMKMERVMKSLLVKKLNLWPRFHLSIATALEESPPDVVDIRVPLTPSMLAIQNAILEVMDACLKELRKTNKVDVEDLTVENGLFKSFDEIVRMQLDPIWHTIGRKTKRLVADLKTLRKLAEYLIRYDAVTFLKYLDTVRASEGVKSVWVFAGPAHRIFELAKRRVYQIVRTDGEQVESVVKQASRAVSKGKAQSKNKGRREQEEEEADAKVSGKGVELEVVAEEMPKWKVYKEILEEIQQEIQSRPADLPEDSWKSEARVLVACKDERTAWQLQRFILKGPEELMREEWNNYLLAKAELHGMTLRDKKKSRSKPQAQPQSAHGLVEQTALLAACAEVVALNKMEESSEAGTSGKRCKGKGKRKKRPDNTEQQVSEEPVIPLQNTGATDMSLEDVGASSLVPPVQYYALESDQYRILDTTGPSYVIVYDPDMKFVREMEVFKAKHPQRRLKVYFLFYEESTEGKKFEASIQRETTAFETLIRQKASMIIPVDQTLDVPSPQAPNSVSSRKAGGRKNMEKHMQIVVDMREFSSSLPCVLHQQGMRILPVTLEVGDYVLSPEICVERKSIADLYASFSSGRLYHQAETMTRYYRLPVLLIEFSQDKSFSLQSANEVGDDIVPANIVSKMSLLVLHFPRLRIVWSRSLHATAELFATLKSNQDEPDAERAMRVGVPTEDGLIEGDVRAENYNTTAVEMLRRLPGVTDANYRTIMDGCKSLAELSIMPFEQLAELMGGQRPARMLRDFLDAKFPTL